MQIKAKISFEYQTAEQAVNASKSLKPDNMEFINSCILNNRLLCNIKGQSLKTILATVDDLLFCEMMVERMLELE
ncbi:MAG: hypothetical protein LLF83_02885 [Methanobacterium sp.]|nr:hypothetical protein [Methanobacterium sp.]